ncbi:MAG: tetratricopeptide repeat protein [Nitrospirota bacterium]
MEKATSEIVKLTERISKDPKSKLFVPLAEEYKKAGEIELAVDVLLEGLKNNPGYVTARSFLGRLLMEKGDLAGAQKELEEVIKAIPDNLLAQRKLGDIYVLQGKSKDALDRYKAALALNPGDKEVPSLIADIEAGRDVSARLPRPKVQAPAAPVVKPQPAAPSAPPKAAPAAAAKPAASSVPKAAPTPGSAAAVQAPPPVSPPTSARTAPPVTPTPPVQPRPEAAIPPAPAVPDEAEVIEDIIDIEPLEHAAPAELKKTEPAAAPVSMQEQEQTGAEAPEAAAFDLSEQPMDMGISVEDPTSVVWGGEETAPPPGKPAAAAEEGSDDLNTNTLAELYISQGFYDKAIEVYQGMLAERPGNKALLNKLEQLRAMAGAAETSAGFTAVNAGPGEYTPPSPDVFADAAEAPAAAVPSPARTTVEPPVVDERPLAEAPPPKAAAEPAPVVPAAGPQAASTRRQETIDRLESWLKNIMKENH